MNKNQILTKTLSVDQTLGKPSTSDQKIITVEKRFYHITVELYRLRKHIGMTQQQLANKSGIPRATISKIESGTRNVTLETLMRLAQSLNSDIEIHLTKPSPK